MPHFCITRPFALGISQRFLSVSLKSSWGHALLWEAVFSNQICLCTLRHARNITTAIQFYSLLGFEVDCRFRAGPARAAWLTLSPSSTTGSSTSSGACLELIEVPSYILNEPKGMRRKAADLMENQQELGHNHIALDVTQQIRENDELNDLAAWMDRLDQSSFQRFGRNLRVALPPRQQMMGRNVYELAFIYDADGSLVEFLHQQASVSQSIESGWDPWDGQGFVGKNGNDKSNNDKE